MAPGTQDSTATRYTASDVDALNTLLRRRLRRRRGLGLRPLRAVAVSGRRRIRFRRRRTNCRRRFRARRRRRGTRRRGSGRRRARPVRRRRPMHPVVTLAIPRPAGIITAPIIAEAERYDADPELRSILQHRNSLVLIIEEKKRAIDPAAVRPPVHIAPGPVIEAAVDVDQRVRRQGRDQRVIGARAGTHVQYPLGVRRTCMHRRTAKPSRHDDKCQEYPFHRAPNRLRSCIIAQTFESGEAALRFAMYSSSASSMPGSIGGGTYSASCFFHSALARLVMSGEPSASHCS
jgi:hypothetical protein